MTYDQQHRDMLAEHLPYEITMLRRSYEFLARDDGQKLAAAFSGAPEVLVMINNATIESFWIHARALLEFFRRQSQIEGRTASAQDFTKTAVTYDLPFGNLEDQINEQICHLQYKRFRDADKKLNSLPMQRIKESLDRAITLFETNLSDEAKSLWPSTPTSNTNFTAYFGGATGASSTFTEVKSDTSTSFIDGEYLYKGT